MSPSNRDKQGSAKQNGYYWALLKHHGPFADPIDRYGVAQAIKAHRAAVRKVVRAVLKEALAQAFADWQRLGFIPKEGDV